MRENGGQNALSSGGSLMRSVLCCIVLVFTLGAPLHTLASPRIGNAPAVLAAAPDWMSADTASLLALDFDVLVPGWLPAPFSDQPRVSTASGYYELYWLITGGAPTFLQITGSVGGDIPDFSWYDRNNELTVNADVGGVPAYRDLTPIYDNVYWEVGNVVYTVSSQGLTDTDSLTLANALILLEQSPPPPPEQEPEPEPTTISVPGAVTSGATLAVTVSNGNGATLNASGGAFVDTGTSTYAGLDDATVTWTAPDVVSEESVTFSLTNDSAGDWIAGATTIVIPHVTPSLSLSCLPEVSPGEQVVVTAGGAGSVVVEASQGFWPEIGPNIDFDAEAGGSQLSGNIGGSGSVALLWQAPETTEPVSATIILSGMGGMTTASCVIAVTPPGELNPTALSPGAPTSTSTPGTSSAAAITTETPPQSQPGANGSARSTAAPTMGSSTNQQLPRRNRPSRDTSVPAPTPSATSTLRLPDSDGTGGAGHPSYVGAPSGVGGGSPLVAPTSAPLPPAPRPIPSGVTRSNQENIKPDAPTPPPMTPVSTETASRDMDTVEATIGSEGGVLSHPAGAVLTIPAGVFRSPSRVSLRSVPDRALSDSNDVALVPGTGYDIEVYAADGRAVTRLTEAVTLGLALPPGLDPRQVTVYAVELNTLEEIESVSGDEAMIRASLTHFSQFAAGTPREERGLPGWIIPWLVVAGTAVVVLAASAMVGSLQRRHARITRRSGRQRVR